MLEPTALEICLEFLIHVPWQRPPFGRPLISEHRIVLRDELMEQRRFRTVPPVAINPLACAKSCVGVSMARIPARL
jgi:hypothetical protein